MKNLVASNPKMDEILVQLMSERQKKYSIVNYLDWNKIEYFADNVCLLKPKEKGDFIVSVLNYPFINLHEKNLLIENLLRQKLEWDSHNFGVFIQKYLYQNSTWAMKWGLAIKQIEKFLEKKVENYSELASTLEKAISKHSGNYYYGYSSKIQQKLNVFVAQFKGEFDNNSVNIRPFIFDKNDDFGEDCNGYLKIPQDDDKYKIYDLLHNAATTNGAKPSSKWYEPFKTLQNSLTNEHFKKHIKYFLTSASNAKVVETTGYPSRVLFNKTNTYTIKGIIWASLLCYDKEILQILVRIVDKSFQKIPGIGPAAAAVGNAALYVLANVEGLEGVNYLSRLKLKIKQANTQGLIEKYLIEAATKRNIPKIDLEDIANDDYGLNTEGVRTETFGDYKAELSIVGLGKTEIKWLKPDGSPQKTEPAFVKTAHAEALKNLKNDAKQIQIGLVSQRDRLDRMFRLERKMTLEHFKNYYLYHGLMSYLTRRIIWIFHLPNGQKQSGIFMGASVLDENGEKIAWDTEGVLVGLWHPALETIENVQKWRTLLEEFQVHQPLKQAYREVYWLTDAEVNTGTYSNRFAAHILKQHQFNSLAKTRGWRYSLLGTYDKGYESEIARLDLPEYGLRAEFWVSEVNADNAYNDTGIWHYISTDQVRFHNIGDGMNTQAVALHQIPKLLFSEVLRDVDLFVGVASVGNDPAWRDNGGLLQFRNYWESYSFGNLNETAKLRKSILEKILPKLKIAKVTHLEDKFLVVKGTFRSYKIHLGSTNILMTPNDQYLCIVPDRSKPKDENIYLPFEGDAGLSVIISKAFLLAADDKITDTTITRQIHNK